GGNRLWAVFWGRWEATTDGVAGSCKLRFWAKRFGQERNMRAWRTLTLLALLLMLQGCLVTFREPLPASEAAPIPLLGTWQGEDGWGDELFLRISRVGNHQYRAVRRGQPGQSGQRRGIRFHRGPPWAPLVSVGRPAQAPGRQL